jgi:Zn-dependent peptidase ImmA (M78 family)
MEFKRFKDIIVTNRNYTHAVKEAIQEFHDLVIWTGDIPKIMKEIGKKLDVLIIEIPMYDSDFGAIYLNTGYSKYLLLNSNQPRNKMYFSFCHDIYHILKGTPDYINEKREVHFNQDYTNDENECKASLFAANLLIPEIEFRKLYGLYKEDNEDISIIVIRLMNYFNAPFVAVLIRLFELDILKKVEDIKELLILENQDIEVLFDKMWIDKEILKPTLNDEMVHVLGRLEAEGIELIKEQLISEYNYGNIMENIKKIYNEIRLNVQDG